MRDGRLFVTVMCGLLMCAGVAFPQDSSGVESATGTTRPCQTSGVPDPCVLTGQYNPSRTSTNAHETQLAGFNATAAATFGLARFYPVTHPMPGTAYEPIVAQPLYATHIPQPGGGTKNVLVIASLGDWVYAFDTATGNLLWSVNLGLDCGSTGVPFLNNHAALPGASNLPFYGVVATPVIDVSPSNPFLYVASACTATYDSTAIQWNLDAIDLKAGKVRASQPIQDQTFNSSNQLARASLLLTHPPGGGTEVYITFGAGIHEVAADCQGCSSGQSGAQYAYSGTLFGYSVTYSSTAPFITFNSLGSPFHTLCSTGAASCTSGFGTVFPPVYTGFDTNGYPLGPPSCAVSGGCPMGEAWAVSGGGIWMGSKGPSAGGSGSIYLAAGNGAFGCAGTGAGQTACTDPQQVHYWGMSAMKFPPGTAANPLAPVDFFAPYVQRYTTNMTTADPAPAPYQTQELARFDLDLGTSGVVLMHHTFPQNVTFAMTADKSGYLYVMPAETQSLGLFQPNDSGLTSGTLTTQTPFQVTRLPQPTNLSTCLTTHLNSQGKPVLGGSDCDELFAIAWLNYTANVTPASNNDLMIAWPYKESVEVFKGALSSNNYSFGTAPVFDPCTVNSSNCTGTNPNFPASADGSVGPGMAVAANGVNAASLWGVVPLANSAGSSTTGSLYAYAINSDGSLTYAWDSRTGTHKCSVPPVPAPTGWFVPSFTEPTVADGVVYVPTVCAVTDGKQYSGCPKVPSGSSQSGVIAFTICP